ncbi:hypothetical protein [Paenibacillus glacialis]|uniref:Uncharacterized protein n=1 Tax=Paenibacillus glacialis TaxID=494026 RepID=A0A168D4X1_9BACL|nr:hypothetical protein [Paenibacillus glacialis]OAB33871.1 hypothetical protein PGLA_23420 [Paenibacillus glacialis]
MISDRQSEKKKDDMDGLATDLPLIPHVHFRSLACLLNRHPQQWEMVEGPIRKNSIGHDD